MKWFKGYWHWHDSHWDQQVFLFAGAFPPLSGFLRICAAGNLFLKFGNASGPLIERSLKKSKTSKNCEVNMSMWFLEIFDFCYVRSLEAFQDDFFFVPNHSVHVSRTSSPTSREQSSKNSFHWTVHRCEGGRFFGEIVKDERWEQKKGFNLKVASTAKNESILNHMYVVCCGHNTFPINTSWHLATLATAGM